MDRGPPKSAWDMALGPFLAFVRHKKGYEFHQVKGAVSQLQTLNKLKPFSVKMLNAYTVKHAIVGVRSSHFALSCGVSQTMFFPNMSYNIKYILHRWT